MTVLRARIKYGCILAVLTIGAGAIAVWPVHQRVRDLDEDLSALSLEVDNLSLFSDHVVEADRTLKKLEERRFRELKPTPGRADLPGMIKSIMSAIAELPLQGSNVNRGQRDDSFGAHQSLSLIVDTEGDLEGIFQLIRRIEVLPRLICIHEIVLREPAANRAQKSIGEETASGLPDVQATISLNAYYRTEPSIASADGTSSDGVKP